MYFDRYLKYFYNLFLNIDRDLLNNIDVSDNFDWYLNRDLNNFDNLANNFKGDLNWDLY